MIHIHHSFTHKSLELLIGNKIEKVSTFASEGAMTVTVTRLDYKMNHMSKLDGHLIVQTSGCESYYLETNSEYMQYEALARLACIRCHSGAEAGLRLCERRKIAPEHTNLSRYGEAMPKTTRLK